MNPFDIDLEMLQDILTQNKFIVSNKNKDKPKKTSLVSKYSFNVGFDSAEYFKNKALEKTPDGHEVILTR